MGFHITRISQGVRVPRYAHTDAREHTHARRARTEGPEEKRSALSCHCANAHVGGPCASPK